MKRLSVPLLLLALLAGCASEPKPTVTTVSSIASPQADDDYIARKDQEVRRLEHRLADLRTLASDPKRRLKGSHARLQALVAQQYEKLGQAKADLRVLHEAKGSYTDNIVRHLDDTLDSMRMVLNLMVAE